jgi:hypothetical protein
MKLLHIKLLLVTVLMLFLSFTSYCQKKPKEPFREFTVGLSDLLHVFYDPSSLPHYQESVCAQVSSYDTTGGNDDGFSGLYSFIKRNEDSTLVIFDVVGPGVINRIWTPTPSYDSLDFYIDSQLEPTFTICYHDLFSGNVFPFIQPLCGNQLGGFYCYLPILFQNHCKIIFRGKNTQFHQIQYRLYPPGTPVKSFNLRPDEKEKADLKKIKSLWTKESKSINDFYDSTELNQIVNTIYLAPGQTAQVMKKDHGGRILGMEFSPASSFEGLSKNIDIRITWDNEKESAVYCPAADFFGYAFGVPSMKSLLIGTDGEKNYCYFPMPFDESALVELIYRKPEDFQSAIPVSILCKVFYTNKPRDPVKEGKFYSYWNKNSPAKERQPHLFLKASGKGHYIGTVLQAQGLESGMTTFFEGDDSTAIDGHFRMHGTGSEDYFNGGWYALPDRWDAAMSLPLSGAIDYSLPFCRTGGYRLFLSDKISFEKSIYHSIEHGPVNNKALADYTSVCYYYCSSLSCFNPPPSNQTSKIFLPDTFMFYPQLMFLGINDNISIKTEWAYLTGGETYTFTANNESGLRIPLKELPYGDYRVFVDFIRHPEGCIFSLWQRQTILSTSWIDSYQNEKIREKKLYLADVHIDNLLNTITLRFRTTPSKNQFMLNRLIFVRK